METFLQTRYNSIAILLHWVMAIAFLGMLCSGFAMEYLDLKNNFKFTLVQLHKSTGVLLLIAIFFRLAWRLIMPLPPLPAEMSRSDMALAKVGHWALYAVMLIMPISGWIMVSSSSYGLPTIVFDTFEWPHIQDIFFMFDDLAGNKKMRALSGAVHFYGALMFVLLIAVHIAAVIKHYQIDRVNLLKRMWWGYDEIEY